jgi:GTP cyclohydrolase II
MAFYTPIDKTSPRKMQGLIDGGIDVVHEPHEIEPTSDSMPYLATKKKKLDHMLNKYIKE